MTVEVWQRCLSQLENELSDHDLNVWIRPLQARVEDDVLRLLAPNQFVRNWVEEKHRERIEQLLAGMDDIGVGRLEISIGSQGQAPATPPRRSAPTKIETRGPVEAPEPPVNHNLEEGHTFSSFVEGKSNQMAKAAALHVAKAPGDNFYNPLFLYGGVGLGKTHLMHAVGHAILERNPKARVVYLHSERFVGDMVKALQHNAIDEFKRLYRSVDTLLIDDIQFFAGKERSQEEFFHTFNALLERKQQMILTCDRYPKEVDGLEERLKSRFGWGLTVAIEPPELEERVAILKSKAELANIDMSDDVAFFIAQKVRSNVRELEGAMKRVIANSQFTGRAITVDFAREQLRDQIASQDRLVTLENIQRTVADYYKIRVSDLLSKSRSRSVTRPRQIAMALASELTNHSLPEIGHAFGGRDHTTVLYARNKVRELRQEDGRINEDFQSLLRMLSS